MNVVNEEVYPQNYNMLINDTLAFLCCIVYKNVISTKYIVSTNNVPFCAGLCVEIGINK
jgi:hypothetical protein